MAADSFVSAAIVKDKWPDGQQKSPMTNQGT